MLPAKKTKNGRIMSDETINEALLDKLRQCALKPAENIEQLRSVAARLHSRAGSQDKTIREHTLERLRRKKPDLMPLLLNLLENIRDLITAASVAGIIHECISPKSGASRSSALRRLVDLNATNTLVKMVNLALTPNGNLSEPLLQELIFILGQLAQKDPKFSLKVRLLNGVKAFHYLLRVHYHNHNKMLVPVLIILKTLARNTNTVAQLTKDGITSTVEKALVQISFSPSIRLRLLLNLLNYLSKNSRFCTALLRTTTVQWLVKMFERWERYDGKMRIKICNYTLLTLQHLCLTKAGRNAIRGCNGHSVLYKFCTWCPDDKVYDTLLSRVCSIVAMCMERRDLPLASLASPAQFQLPANAGLFDQEVDSDDSGGEETGEDGQEDDVDDNNIAFQSGLPPVCRRDVDDLKMYEPFWSEMTSQESESPPVSPATMLPPFTFASPYTTLPNNYRFPIRDDIRTLVSDNVPGYPCNSQVDKAISLAAVKHIKSDANYRTVYCHIASRVQSVLPFVKVGYPDLMGGESTTQEEPLSNKDRRTCRGKLLASVERGLRQENSVKETCYDLDQLCANGATSSRINKDLCNYDEERVGLKECNHSRLVFESRFESGNLRKAIQVGAREYDLLLTPDVNSSDHCIWFYFEVSNMEAGVPYVFNIINCEKPNSQFNYGMRPLLYSVREAMVGRAGWVRTGTDICYFRNAFPSSTKRRTYLTLTFTIRFPHTLDVCYLAYHYPYTYSQLLSKLFVWSQTLCQDSAHLRVKSLCLSLKQNEVPVVTITAPPSYHNPIQEREVIFLTARVHPAECNSSWIMQGILEYLLSDSLPVVKVRHQYVFKIVPMLNTEGVINGCHRCGLTNEDLNRRWNNPSVVLHPDIYHTKGLIDYSVRILKKVPYVFCDIHGHSRRKNVFLYGCSNQESWHIADRAKPDVPLDYLVLPNIMQNYCSGFSLPLCRFGFERHKEATARVTVWREFGVKRSYTMECSYCGWDIGIYKGNHIITTHLKEIGTSLVVAVACLREETEWRVNASQLSLSINGFVDRPCSKKDDGEASPLDPSDCSSSDEEGS